MQILDYGPQVSDDAVAVLQQFICASLPKDYKNFLVQFGGGRPEPDNFLFVGKHQESSVQRFYGINRKDTYDFVSKFQTYQGRIPDEFIAIASDPGGNQICLGIKGPNRNNIFFWDHEFEADDDSPPTKENMTLIAHSFTDFINNFSE